MNGLTRISMALLIGMQVAGCAGTGSASGYSSHVDPPQGPFSTRRAGPRS